MTTVATISLGMVVTFGFLTVVEGIMVWRFGIRSYRRMARLGFASTRLPRFVEPEEVHVQREPVGAK
jgi:hypothetical protein